MTGLELRPLSLGEILDRTFSLYRRHFLLFMGIAGVPSVVLLALSLSMIVLPLAVKSTAGLVATLLGLAVAVVGAMVAYLFSQGATIFAVSDVYLGRSAAAVQSLRRVWGHLGSLFGTALLNGLVVGVGTLLLIAPGVYLMCRLLVVVPATLIEDRNPSDSLSRSFELTKGFAGRSFMIFLLYMAMAFAANMLLTWPFSFMAGWTVATKEGSPLIWQALAQIGGTITSMLVTPFLLIATSVFYFDLRVRKEAFDLQFMMDPNSERMTAPNSGLSILP
jgi:hypothetical protein